MTHAFAAGEVAHTRGARDFALQSRKGLIHRASLACVWLAVMTSSIVMAEPAPTDALTMGLFVLLPVVGLFAANDKLLAPFAVWLAISALSYVASTFAADVEASIKHTTVSLYLYAASFIFAGFIAKRPLAHARLVLNAYLCAAVVAASLGIIGYLDLFPGAYDLLTRYDRASGPFKDPNVFGPFLIPALLTALHLWLTQPLSRGAFPLLVSAVLSAGLLLSFSRGAWAAAAFALAIYIYFYLLGARRNVERLKLALLVMIGAAIVALVLAAALQSDAVNALLEQRASLTQPYDEGPEGRFGGQMKAIGVILENPLGIGSVQFAPYIHHEEPHNVYLAMFMNAGWLGGFLYVALLATVLIAGFRHALVATRTRGLFVIAYAALAATILLGFIIDTDHWRHFYLLLGIATGLMASDTRPLRENRIVADVRHVLLRPVLIIPPTTRARRIVRRLPAVLSGNPVTDALARPHRARRRKARLALPLPA